MGRSAGLANRPEELAKVPAPITVFKEKLNRYFQVFRKGDDLYQSEFEKDGQGNIIFQITHKLEYVVGNGETGFTYIIRRGDYLFEAPLSYYSAAKEWDLSPGYEFVDHGFSRPALEGCIVCHTGLPQVVPDRIGLYRNPPFLELAITCENCHGPGQLHVEERRKTRPGKVDDTIVNPAHLPPRLAEDICMNCHQGGGTRVLQPGKQYTDFRPSQPLYQTIAIFKLPLKEEDRQQANALENLPPVRGSVSMPTWWKNSSMQMSKCYLASNGRLSCLTCHNGHETPSAEDAPAYYRKRCLTCHKTSSCRLPVAQRQPRHDCAGCHMPKRPVGGILHSSSTNHRIMVRPGQALPDAAFEKTTPELPGLVWLNKPAGASEADLSPRLKLAAYGELEGRDPALRQQYLDLLEQFAKSPPSDPLVLGALARKKLLEGDSAAALSYLEQAEKLDPQSFSVLSDTADALTREGRLDEAGAKLERAVALYPFAPQLSKLFVLNRIQLKKFNEAREAMKRHVETFPEDSFMRGLLQKVEAQK